jgi:streptogramin lyase
VKLDFPPGNVAVSGDGRVFFAYHPFAQANRFVPATVFELVNGTPKPFPDERFQASYQGVFGMTVDGQNRLWFTEPASLDHESSRLLAFDLSSNQLVFDHRFPPGVAKFAQDLRVTPDGSTIILADTGLFRFSPAHLIVFSIADRSHRTVLAGHPSTQPMDYLIQTRHGPHKLGYGLVSFVVGVDGLAFDAKGEWLFFASMTHDSLFKVATATLTDASASADTLGAAIVRVGAKPLSDGIAIDASGRVLVTDIEHGGIMAIDPLSGALHTLVKMPQVVWADGVVAAPDASVIFTDSAIPNFVDQLARPPSRERLQAAGPYFIYRFRLP